MFQNYSMDDSPTVNDTWKNLSQTERDNKISALLDKNTKFNRIKISRTTELGQVYIEFNDPIPANERGMLLLDIEELLKKEIDPGLNLWCEPIGDKNSLRKLRGLQIKS